MLTIETHAPDDALPMVADIIGATVAEPMAEDAPYAAAYNDALADNLQSAATSFATEYNVPCAVEDAPCARILASTKHAAFHIVRVTKRGGNVLHIHGVDGHTDFDDETQRRTLARLWADRVAAAQSDARDTYETVRRYAP